MLRDYLLATVGEPQVAALQPRGRRPNTPQFRPSDKQPQFIGRLQNQAPKEQELREQLSRIAEKRVAPQLNPIQRVTNPNTDLVAPSNFHTYYDRLRTIGEANQHLESAAAARAAFQRMQSMMPVASFRGASPMGPVASGSGVPPNPRENFKFAQNLSGQFGWGSPEELGAWYTLGMKESGWRNTAQNPTSTAYGIGQFLNSTWSGVGIGKTSDPYLQVLAMARYIKNRYGSPSRALAFHLRNNWY